jgi:hypothetical protein
LTLALRRATTELLIRDPYDRATIARIPGDRMDGLRFSTGLNFGYRDLSFSLLGRDLSHYIPDDEAVELMRTWFGGRVRLYVDGQQVWVGRVSVLDAHQYIDDLEAGRLCAFSVEAEGLYALYLDDNEQQPEYPAEDDEEPTASASQLVRDATEAVGSEIAQIFTNVAETDVAAPVGADDAKYWYDHIVDALKAGSAADVEHWFGIYDPADGPYLQPILAGWPKAKVSVVGTDARMTKRLSELVTGGRARWSNESEQRVSHLQDDPFGAVGRNNGIVRRRTITLDRVGRSGAERGLYTYLQTHADPRGPIGDGQNEQITLKPSPGELWPNLRGHGGEMVPPWHIRAGDTIDLFDLHPSDRTLNRLFVVDETEVDLDNGALSIVFDRRAIRSRLHERPSDIALLRSVQSPGSAGGVVVSAHSPDGSEMSGLTATNVLVTIIGEDGIIEFTVPSTKKYIVHISSTWFPSSTTAQRLVFGYALDDDDFDDDSPYRTAQLRIDPANNDITVIGGAMKPRRITANETHTLKLFARGQTGGATLLNCRVEIRTPT